jgi:predicted AlkP superfamily phosphohydrolase/phosphomutase
MNLSRTLIIGLDGATFDLIDPLVRAGYLPTLGRLMAEGVHGPLSAWPNWNSASAWTSMVTGYNPGQHGIHDFGNVSSRGGTAWHPITAANRSKDPFWCLLSAAGRRVGIINVPISYPADPVNGFMLSGLHTPGVHSPGFAYPPGLLDELARQGIDYVIDVPMLGDHRSKRALQRLPWTAEQMAHTRASAVLYLMQTHPWDVLMAVFVATDRVQHRFWPKGYGSVESADWAPIRNLYRQIDSFLGDSLEFIDENTTVLVVSDHGFGPAHPAGRCLNPLFAQLGLLRYRQGGSRLPGRLLGALLHYGRQMIPGRLQDLLIRALPRLYSRAVSEHKYSGIEWSRTRVFASPCASVVYINPRGQELEGEVPSEDRHLLRERVRDILLNLTDPSTGRRLIRAVHWREDLYHGPYVERAADLLIEWEDDEVVRDALCYRTEGDLVIVQAPKRSSSGQQWIGSHRPQGIFIAWGPHIKRGATVANACLYDIAPTILYLQNHLIPEDMDGRVLTDIFIEEHVQRNPVKLGTPASTEPETNVPALDTEDERIIEERLRGLGYIE